MIDAIQKQISLTFDSVKKSFCVGNPRQQVFYAQVLLTSAYLILIQGIIND
jgi:hypothetical protein